MNIDELNEFTRADLRHKIIVLRILIVIEVFLLVFGMSCLWLLILAFVSLVTCIILVQYYQRELAIVISSSHLISESGEIRISRTGTQMKKCVNVPARKPHIKCVGARDNMNCTQYVFTAKYSRTKRMHTNHTIYVFDGERVEDRLKQEGYIEPMEYRAEPFIEASGAQISYLRDIGLLNQPTGISLDDASAILSRYEDDDIPASESFFRYAASLHVPLSYYVGTARGYGTVTRDMNNHEKIALFIYSIYRDFAGIESENMRESSYLNSFYKLSDELQQNQAFMKSFLNISEYKYRCVGTKVICGKSITGISRNSNAYKIVVQKLQQYGML